MAYSENQIETIFAKIINRITEGESVRSILKDKDMPDYVTMLTWMEKDENKFKRYARAKEESADSDADNIGNIAELVLKGVIEPNAARVAIDAYKWSAGKKKPKKYGDSSSLELTGKDGKDLSFEVIFKKDE